MVVLSSFWSMTSEQQNQDGTQAPQDVVQPAPGRPQPEIWRLQHPQLGPFSVAVGNRAQLTEVDPQFRSDDMEGPQKGCVFFRGTRVLARASQLGSHRVAVHPEDDDARTGSSDEQPDQAPATEAKSLLLSFADPRIVVKAVGGGTRVAHVRFKDGSQVAEFAPPEGSWAARRQAAMEASPWKRAVYPLMEGLGRAGAAIAGIVLLPLILRLLDPVWSFLGRLLPDLGIPWQQISLPRLPWPEIDLPSIPWPSIELPEWAGFLLEYSKVWVPLLIGIAVAVGALRTARRTRRTRQDWQVRPSSPATSADDRTPSSGDEAATEADRLSALPGADAASAPAADQEPSRAERSARSSRHQPPAWSS